MNLFSSIPSSDNPGDLVTSRVANRCRACGVADMRIILNLGELPLANALLKLEQTYAFEQRYPLILVFCPSCSLVQITETVSPELLYRTYPYFSSFSDTMLSESRKTAERVIRDRSLDCRSKVIEIASNDGYLLQVYRQAGVPVLGIEPALNIAAVASRRGIPTISAFFGVDLARRFVSHGHRADVIHANNVLAHVDDLSGFLAGLNILLKEQGIAIIEVPYVRDMIDHVEFDTIYHEHLSYFSLTALGRLFAGHGLAIVRVERIPIHGGSLRIFVSPAASGLTVEPTVQQILAEERSLGLDRFEFYANFGKWVTRLKHALTARLRELKFQGKRIAAYGASAKGATLLNYCGIDGSILDFVVDRNPAKQELFTPGTHLPIYAPEKLLEVRPDCVLLLTWNFAEEIIEQQSEYRRRGGQFLVPVPEPRFV